MRGGEPEALADQLPGVEVDDAAFDAAAADIENTDFIADRSVPIPI